MPKTKTQCEQVKLERRTAIINSSLYLFLFKGYNNVTVDDVCKANQCSHGLFYHYFKNKEELFHTLMGEAVIPFIKNVTSYYYKDGNGQDRLELIIDNILDNLKDDSKDKACIIFFVLTMHNRLDEFPKPKQKSIAEIKKEKHLFEVIVELVKEGQDKGVYWPGDTLEYSLTLMGLIQGITFEKIMHNEKHKFVCPSRDIIMRIVKKGV